VTQFGDTNQVVRTPSLQLARLLHILPHDSASKTMATALRNTPSARGSLSNRLSQRPADRQLPFDWHRCPLPHRDDRPFLPGSDRARTCRIAASG